MTTDNQTAQTEAQDLPVDDMTQEKSTNDAQSVEAEEIEETEEIKEMESMEELGDIAQAKENDIQENSESPANMKKQLQEANDRYLRLMADFENYKRRMSAERIQLMQSAAKDLIIELLPVVDDLERGLEAAGTPEPGSPAEAIAKGVELIHNKLLHSLKSRGLTSLDAVASPFDAELHEAIGQAPGKNGEVIAEVEKGYTLNGQVIRHSKVIVGAE